MSESVAEIVAGSCHGRAPAKPARSQQPTRVANRTALWAGTDGRSLWARRVGELLVAHIGDLGGEGNISEAERALAKRCAVLICELERREATFAKAGEVSDSALAIYQTTVN